MKKLLLLFLALILCVQFSYAQNRELKSLWDLEYGMTKKTIRQKMKQQWNLMPELIPDTNSSLFYAGCKYFGEKTDLVFFDFAGDMLYKSTVVIEPSPSASVFEVYNKLRAELIKAYGNPPHSESQFQKPYAKGDGRELEALKKDKTDFFSIWDLPAENPVTSIGLLISSPGTIYVYYTNLDMRDKADVLKSLAVQY